MGTKVVTLEDDTFTINHSCQLYDLNELFNKHKVFDSRDRKDILRDKKERIKSKKSFRKKWRY